MAKIWEVDYTVFSGASNIALDNIAGNDLVNNTNIIQISTLPGFNFRGGVDFPNSGGTNYYGGNGTGLPSVARWRDPFTGTSKRSFVMWVYLQQEGTDGSTYMWGGGSSSTFPTDGFMRTNRLVTLRRGGGSGPGQEIPSIEIPGWHSIISTVDRIGVDAKLYIDGSLVGSTGGTFSSSPSSNSLIGHSNSGQESDMKLGYTATYDHVLTPTEVSGIHASFLSDTIVAQPIASLSGTVHGLQNQTISGADVFLVYNDSPFQLVDYSTTDFGGFYEIDVPYFGDFTLVSSHPPDVPGARAVSLTVSGIPGSGTITFHDGK